MALDAPFKLSTEVQCGSAGSPAASCDEHRGGRSGECVSTTSTDDRRISAAGSLYQELGFHRSVVNRRAVVAAMQALGYMFAHVIR